MNTPNNKQKSTISSFLKEKETASNAIKIPQISLPKGGGALKGIDENFKINAANGMANFSIPIPSSPARSNFEPVLSLNYSSGNGNGVYGLGWSINHPIIQRKTEKQLPRYRDNLEEDTFMFSEADDLVPFLEKDGNKWIEKIHTHNGLNSYTVKRYRPRIEGNFARIEKINHPSHGVYWKVTTKENIVTIFGKSTNARIVDPENPTHIFQWLPEFSYDNKGNCIQYNYKKEDLSNVPNKLYEKNRLRGLAPFTNTYLKSVQYGNKKAYYADINLPYAPQEPIDKEYFFELILDYGEHESLTPTPQDEGLWNYRSDAFSSYRSGFEIRTQRLCQRILMFHHFKDEKQFEGTEEEEMFGENYLVRSLDLIYEPSSINNSNQSETTYLKSIIQCGYIRKPNGEYSKKTLPPIEFSYQQLQWNSTVKRVSTENIVNAPVGLTNNYQWIDLHGEGIAGILTEQEKGWYYKDNWGSTGNKENNVTFSKAKKIFTKPSFTGLSNGTLSIQDLASNGQKQVVVNNVEHKGYFELEPRTKWKSFKTFEQTVNVNLQDPNTRLIDLNGNGQPDIVITEENAFTWYPSNGKKGHLSAQSMPKVYDEELGPSIIFADQEQSIFLADLSGDGLTDIVRIRNREICYWANKGYGRFSAKITMENAPIFDHTDAFNPKYIHLADVSGTGATDIIYLGKNKFKAFINLSGNAWSEAHEIAPSFPIDINSKLSVVDLLGTGTSCIVWSSDLPIYTTAPMRYIDLMSSKKPHLLIHYKNNLGKENSIEYQSSTHSYLNDKKQGKPWITKLPFPVQVVKKLIVEEKITAVRFTSEYRYHHGYYDHFEREFRGFGMVEQLDSEYYEEWTRNNVTNQLEQSEALYQKPVLTKTWFHTGAFLDREKILTLFKEEYWHQEYNKQFFNEPLNITEPELSDTILSSEIQELFGDDYRDAIRACKGGMLRQEIFVLDAPSNATQEALKLQMKPYMVSTKNCYLQLLQPRKTNKQAVFLVTESETISIHYERNETDPKITHTLNTKIDLLGNILEKATIAYGRKEEKAAVDIQKLTANSTDFSEEIIEGNLAEQLKLQTAFATALNAAKTAQMATHITYTQNSFTRYNNGIDEFDDVDLAHAYRLRLPLATKTYELTGFSPIQDVFHLTELENALNIATEIAYHELPTVGLQSRLIEHNKIKYLADDLTVLDFGFFDTLGLTYENYQLAYTPELIQTIYIDQGGIPLDVAGVVVADLLETQGNYTNIDGDWWIRSGIAHLKEPMGETILDVQARFFLPIFFEDPWGLITTVVYDTESFTNNSRNNDGYYLYIKSAINALDNQVQINYFNYRSLSPSRVIDINANPSSVVLDELGRVKAIGIEGNGVFVDENRTTVNLLQAADKLDGIKEYTETIETNQINQLFATATTTSTDTVLLRQIAKDLLQGATTRFIYDFDNYQNHKNQPTRTVSILREEHFSDNDASKIQLKFEYSDGFGNVVMSKIQAEPGLAYYMESGDRKEKDTGADLRWIGNGKTILNNKGKPVKQYEPYFSTNFLYENAADLVEIGVTPIIYYDAIGRIIKTEYPDGTITKVAFEVWKEFQFDQNDTVLESDWYHNRVNHLIDGQLIAQGKDPIKEKQAAQKSALHANTPLAIYLDALGRPILNLEHNGRDASNQERYYITSINFDIEGNLKTVIDARGNRVMSYQYDLLGQRIYQSSMDAGARWVAKDVMGKLLYRWDSRAHLIKFGYDATQRPINIKVTGGDASTPLDNIYELFVYGEGQVDDYTNNLRGQIFQHYDTAGRIQNLQFDFKGNLLEHTREMNANYKDIPNWIDAHLNNPLLFDTDLSTYTNLVSYDALNRATSSITIDGSETNPIYNEAGLLEQMRVKQTGVGEKIFVKNINYNVKGQRQKIVYGNKNGDNLATTIYRYDTETFRLLELKTIKSNGDLLQELHYTYDPIGNIIALEDKAIPTKFFNNQKIEGIASYSYDALYRLIEATGREHAGQAINFGQCDNWQDKVFLQSYHPNDDLSWRNYTQKYTYDPVGNILSTHHTAANGNWAKSYHYQNQNNRLLETIIGGQAYSYTHHDQHGFITSLPHLSTLEWNFKDELQAVAKQVICNENNTPETTYYVYDHNGRRVRKVTEQYGGGSKKTERLYLDGVEIYKNYNGIHSGLERITLHIFDDTRRIAMIDTRNEVDDNTDKRSVRFQFNNHLETASLELDDDGNIISYEEYHPYGTTAYQAKSKTIKAAAKRYRYTSMERDEESGLAYHSARYYLPWLGRWLKPDPIGIEDGVNLYQYAGSNPVKYIDPSGENYKPTYDNKTRTVTYSATVYTIDSQSHQEATNVANTLNNFQGTVTDNTTGDKWTVKFNIKVVAPPSADQLQKTTKKSLRWKVGKKNVRKGRYREAAQNWAISQLKKDSDANLYLGMNTPSQEVKDFVIQQTKNQFSTRKKQILNNYQIAKKNNDTAKANQYSMEHRSLPSQEENAIEALEDRFDNPSDVGGSLGTTFHSRVIQMRLFRGGASEEFKHNVQMHEFFHLFGFGEDNMNESIMNYDTVNASNNKNKKLTPTQFDIQSLYDRRYQ